MAAGRSFSRIHTILVVAAAVLAGVAFWRSAVAPNVFGKRFAEVDPGRVYRSGQLTPAAFRSVHEDYGIKTVIDFGGFPAGSVDEGREQRTADSLGMTRFRLELSGDSTGNPNNYVQALRLMTDPSRQPVLVHCGAGTERTGCAVILYRHIVQGVPLADAVREAEAAGHNSRRNGELAKTLNTWAGPIEQAYRSGGQVAGADPLPEVVAAAPAGAERPLMGEPELARPEEDTGPPPVARPAVLGGLAVQVVLVLLLCIAVYWVRLGSDGFFYSEGHRVLPAWEMLDSGDYLVPRLFGQVYIRKPPGIFWAIAASSELFGRTEFGRAVSAAAMTAGALLSLAFARRWFGRLDPMAGLIGGMAHALSPWFWQIGRVAEIEALHQLAVQASVFLVLDLMVGAEQRSRRASAGMAVGAGLSMAAMAWIKGPAAAPSIAAALVAACIVARSARPLLLPAIRGAFLVAALVLVAAFGAFLSAVARTGGGAVSQSVDEFLWSADRLREVGLLLPTALGSALPVALALLYPWGSVLDPRSPRANRIARAIAWTCIVSLGIYLMIGVNNRRYALPSFAFLAPLAAYAASRIGSGVMVWVPWCIGHAVLLDRPALWFVGMVIFAGVWLGVVEPRRAAHGGREPGLAIARAIAQQDGSGTELWANEVIEARPDVLEYAVRDLAAQGRVLNIRWTADASPVDLPPPGQYLAIRTDAGSEEWQMFRAHGLAERTELICSAAVHEFTFDVYRVRAGG